jgi:hypothetical protein
MFDKPLLLFELEFVVLVALFDGYDGFYFVGVLPL